MKNNEMPSYYAIIPAEVRYDNDLRANEKLLFGEISALSNTSGVCNASNNYFASLYGVAPSAISKWVKDLEKKQYIVVEYEKKGKEIIGRKISITGIHKYYRVFTKVVEGYSQKLKENNTSINNNKLNEFNLYKNFDENLQCDCLTKSTRQRCERKSSFNINGKNYCNQHARDLIPNIITPQAKTQNSYFENEKVNELFDEFLQVRKKLKAINSDRAINTLINKLNKYDDETKYKMIENSIVNSWKDVYELKQNENKKRDGIIYDFVN